MPVFHPAISYPGLENVGEGNEIVPPMVMLVSGAGVVPCVFSLLKDSLYLMATHFGYNVAFPPDEKQESIMSSVIANCPDPMSMPVPSEEVFQTVAVYPVFFMFTVGIAAPEMTVSDDNAPGASPVPPFASNENEYCTGIHSGYSVLSVPLMNTLSMKAASAGILPIGSAVPEPSMPVFHPTIS